MIRNHLRSALTGALDGLAAAAGIVSALAMLAAPAALVGALEAEPLRSLLVAFATALLSLVALYGATTLEA